MPLEPAQAWAAKADDPTLRAKPGRPCVFMPYIGGFPVYVPNAVTDEGYDCFVLEGWHVPPDLDVISASILDARYVPFVEDAAM